MSSEDTVMLSISSHSGLHPDEIARRTFPTARKGVDPEAVRRYLETIANELRDFYEREQAMRRRLQDAERRALEPELDEQTLLRAVGAETARILQTAHESAADVIANAEARAAELIEATSEQSLAEAASIRATAASEAEAVTDAARDEAVALLEATRAECRRIVRDARALRSEVLTDLSDRRRTLRVQLEQLRTGRDSLVEVVDAVGTAVEVLRDRLANAEHEARLAAAEAGDRAAAEEDDLLADAEEEIELAVDLGEAGLSDELVVPVPGEVAAVPDDVVGPGSDGELAGPVTAETEPVAQAAVGALDDVDVEESVTILASPPALAAPPAAGRVAKPDPSHEAHEAAHVPSAALYDVEADLAADLEAEQALLELEEAEAEPEPAIAPRRSVDELFAKIRAGRSSEAGATADAAASDAEASEVASTEVASTEVASTEVASTEVASTEGDNAPGSDDEGEPGDTDAATTAALARRADLVAPVTAKLARALKRTLQDDQNILLDALRHTSGAPELDTALPEEGQRQRIEKATVALLADAWTVGHSWFGESVPQKSAALEAGRFLAGELASEVTRLLRHRLREALAAVDEGGDGGTDAASAAYREWRSGRIDSTSSDFVTRAFGSGSIAGGKGTPVTWAVDDDGGPCPDCDDNALAGVMHAGEEFPTGQAHPPVHPGCRCLLVATSS